MYDVSMIHYKMHDVWHDFSHDAWTEGFFSIESTEQGCTEWVASTSDSLGNFGPLGYIKFRNWECPLIFVEITSAKFVPHKVWTMGW